MAAGDLIERYLADLGGRLGPLGPGRRRRVVAEARAHLEESAAEVGPAEAVRRFGPAAEVGTDHLGTAGALVPGRAVWAFAAAGLAYGVIQALVAPITFGIFPGGPWPGDVPPRYLAWKVNTSGALMALAVGLGLVALALAWTTRHQPLVARRWPVRLAVAGAAAFTAAWPFEAVFLIQRGHAVAGSPPTLVTAVICAGLLACSLAALWCTLSGLRLVRAALAGPTSPRTAA